MVNQETIKEYYNDYVERQSTVGINKRHESIQNWIERFKIPRTAKVLEIGCGIGTQTELLSRYIQPPGSIYAVDISNKSIELAKNTVRQSHVTFDALDVTEHQFSNQYDLILMPDVLEHIPIDRHKKLFSVLGEILSENGCILIHIPEPEFLKWNHKHHPERLQVIDQPINTAALLQACESGNLRLTYLESYSIWNLPFDYQIIKLVKGNIETEFTKAHKKKKSILKSGIQKLRGL